MGFGSSVGRTTSNAVKTSTSSQSVSIGFSVKPGTLENGLSRVEKLRGSPFMYAIVKTGGKQYKVAEGDLVKVEKIEGESGTAVALTPVLLVDGAAVTSGDALAGKTVNAEIVEQTKGPKINGMHYRNKTGYKRRYGHRQKLTVLKVTGIK